MTEFNERADSLTTDSEFRIIYGLENTIGDRNYKRPFCLDRKAPKTSLTDQSPDFAVRQAVSKQEYEATIILIAIELYASLSPIVA